MVLPPVEKTPVVLLRWTEKALQQQNSEQNSVIDRVKNLLQEHQIVVLPGTSRDTLLLTATQSSLEEQAERDHLVKPRRVFKWKTKSTTSNLKTEHASDSVEIIRDHFQKAPKYRKDFCFPSNGSPTSPSYFDQDGLFSEHERCLLVLGLLERIIVEDSTLLSLLLQSHASPLEHIASTIFHDNNNNRHLRYILQSKEWIDILTPLHLDPLKLHLQKTTFYPLVRMMPPVDDILHYYGPTIAYYFAFMGFLGNWLLALGVLGLSSFLFRSYRNDTIDEDEVRYSIATARMLHFPLCNLITAHTFLLVLVVTSLVYTLLWSFLFFMGHFVVSLLGTNRASIGLPMGDFGYYPYSR